MKKLLLLFALVLTVCSTVKAQAESLTMLSPVGTIGTLDGREAMVVDLGGSIGKVAIATMNVGATNINDYGTPFSAEDALDSDKNGLTDGWYVPSREELVALSENIKDNDDKDSEYGLEWQVSETATLYVPATILIYGEYGGFYMSSSQNKSILAFYYDATKGLTKMVVDNQVNIYPQFVIRPFHKLPMAYSYVYPVYNDPNDVTKGVKEWKTGTVNAIEVTSSDTPVTWGEAGKTTWYVVTGKDVTLSQGAICAGNVNLILADGAKLTANGVEKQAGINVSEFDSNYGYTHLAIYGQAAQSGELEATGGDFAAGIGGGYEGFGDNITINGGTVTATCEDGAAGIGGGLHSLGTCITVNGGKVTANGGQLAAGIGGGCEGIGYNITINGGTVTANGGYNGAGIGVGCNAIRSSSYIFVANILTLKANDDVIENNGEDLALSLAGKQYVTVSDAICNITANQDPNNKANYYSTFYSGTKAYSVPSGVTAYTGAVDGSVLKLTAIEGGIIPAGEAVILRLTTEDNTATKKQFDLTAITTTATKSTTNKLSGTDVAKTLAANDYALSLGQNGVGFYLWEGKSIGAHKAYLYMGDSAAGTKALGFEFED